MTNLELWQFLPIGYLITVVIELPILLLGLSPEHSRKDRLTAGFWLTGCTYPIVVLVLPPLLLLPYGRGWYLLVAETFAPLAECGLFYLGYQANRTDIPRNHRWRNYLIITLANLSSFGLAELWYATTGSG